MWWLSDYSNFSFFSHSPTWSGLTELFVFTLWNLKRFSVFSTLYRACDLLQSTNTMWSIDDSHLLSWIRQIPSFSLKLNIMVHKNARVSSNVNWSILYVRQGLSIVYAQCYHEASALVIYRGHMHNLMSLFSSQVSMSSKSPTQMIFIVTSHWSQLDRVFFNGSSKYRRCIHKCSKSNLHHCHFNFISRQSTCQRYRGEPLLLKISLLSATEVVQLLRENRGLSRTERQK